MIDPYYSDDHVTIYNGDCLEILPELHDVGLVLTSPPYNLRESGRDLSGTAWKTMQLVDGYASHDDDMPHEEYVAWQHELLRWCWRSLSDDGAIFYNHKPLLSRGPDRALRLPFELIPEELTIRQVVTWDRGSGFTRTHAHFVPVFEWVIVLAPEPFRTNTLKVDDVWRIPFETGSEHPAPFPLSLATLAIGSTDAELILDPFMGSGTTLRAAKDLGRKAIGIELEERYCEIAAKRCAQEVLDFGAAA